MERYYILYKGQVQGVGFRYTLIQIANKYKLTGFCQNLDNGNVLVEIQGENINAFIKESLKARSYIRIDDYMCKKIPLNESEEFFTAKY